MLSTLVEWSPALDWVGVSTVVLAALTGYLALTTREAARSAARAAVAGESAVAAAERPVVVPVATHIDGLALVVTLRNVGKGAALNIAVAFGDGVDTTTSMPVQDAGPIGVEQESRVTINSVVSHDAPASNAPPTRALVVSYSDISGRRFQTVAERAEGRIGWDQMKVSEP